MILIIVMMILTYYSDDDTYYRDDDTYCSDDDTYWSDDDMSISKVGVCDYYNCDGDLDTCTTTAKLTWAVMHPDTQW